MSLLWYIQRVRTFSFEEVLYRVKQRVQTHFFDRRLKKNTSRSILALPYSKIIEDPFEVCLYPIFNESINIFKPIDWNLDLQSGKRFPLAFAHSIDIRSDVYGSAKHVWEVNRLLFLNHIALLYQKSKDENYLDLFCFHITDWVNHNPYLGSVNWYSNIEVNLRLINWAYGWKILKGELLLESSVSFKKFFENTWLPQIIKHLEFSFKHPSLYSSANNHLISEYAGLFVGTIVFKKYIRNKVSVRKYISYSQKGLEKEIQKQHTSEGINKEEAAEYIQFINDFFLIAALIGDEYEVPFSESYKNKLHQMAHYLNAILDCKNNYLMYGDGDDGFCLRVDAGGYFNNFKSLLTAFATYFKDPTLKREDSCWDEKCELLLGENFRQVFDSLEANTHLNKNCFYKNSGHYIFRKQENSGEILLHFDAAPLGYLSIAAHGHADALSVILHVDGKPILVDPGTFTYHTHKKWRKYFVSTLAHNTVCVAGLNQATQAGPTLWLNHYKCSTLKIDEDAELVKATHNGYKKLGVNHSRQIQFFRETNEFEILDVLEGLKGEEIAIPFHLHPNVTAEFLTPGIELICKNCRKVLLIPDSKLEYNMVKGSENPIMGWYSEHFGVKEPTWVLYGKGCFTGKVEFVSRIKVLSE